MADNFTANQVQGVLGEWKPLLDGADVEFSADNVQGVSGEWKPVLDESVAAAVARLKPIAVISGRPPLLI